MTRIDASVARKRFAETINRVLHAGERVVLERRGKPVAAFVSAEDAELLEALEDRMDVEAAKRALRENGESIPWAEAKKALGL